MVGTTRAKGRVERRIRKTRVRIEAPRTRLGTTFRKARRSRGDSVIVVAAPANASASASLSEKAA
jgi:hypothetical protein